MTGIINTLIIAGFFSIASLLMGTLILKTLKINRRGNIAIDFIVTLGMAFTILII